MPKLCSRTLTARKPAQDGRSNVDIAGALTLTAAAVSKHIGNIFAKLGLSQSRTTAECEQCC
ncbi:LuxR C-terminal-related transcriptional regulator [Microbacterium sp. NPDC064584]|uniref:LuxR C-terminal-related transcriptional regulator n=1 Tax=Microbacterium sp. NPDC064584 TaxID=3155817 RepID=UPI0034326B9F